MNRLFSEGSMLKKLLFLKAASGGNLTEYTATGNPATFTTDVAKALTGLTIPFTPVQTGSGDPSPENVRPITGWTGINVTSNGATIPISFPDEAGTVYGGTLDVTTGMLTVEWVLISRKWLEWEIGAVLANVTRKTLTLPIKPDMYVQNDAGNSKANFTNVYLNSNSTDTVHYYINIRGNVCYAFLPNDFDGETVVQISAKLITPYEIQLTPTQITTIIGDNTVWTDTNGINTIKYLKKG